MTEREVFEVIILTLLAIAGLFGLVLLMHRYSERKLRRMLEPIAKALNGEVAARLVADSYVRLAGYNPEMRVQILPADDHSPKALWLRRMKPLGFEFSISRETIFTELGDMGMGFDAKINDPIFDQKYFISAWKQEPVVKFLLAGARREIVDYFFASGFTRLVADSESVFAEKSNYRESDLEPSLIKAHIEQLARFAQAQ